MTEIEQYPPHRDQSFEDLLDMASRPFADAVAMPPSVYKSEQFLKAEIDNIFRRQWLCVGRSENIKNPGDYLTYDLVDQPVIIIRDKSGIVRAMANVCLHRMSTLLEGCGHVDRIVCPYHGWTYGTDGALRAAPFMNKQPGFSVKGQALPEVRCEEWNGWIYVTLNPDVESLASSLKGLSKLIEHFQVENYTSFFLETREWNTNWKCLAENFMESYHVPVCHRGTIGPHTGYGDIFMQPAHENFNFHWITKDAELALGNAHPDNTRLVGEQRNTSILMSVYPSHFVTLTPGYFWYLSLQPSGVDHVRITYGGGLSPEFTNDPNGTKYQEELYAFLDHVQDEDQGCTERVYKGLCAPSARPGRISTLEESVYQFAQYLADKTAGFARTFAD